MANSRPLEIPSSCLLALDRLEQCLEVSLAEAARAFALDDLVEQRRPILDRLRENLQEVAVGIAVHQDAELLQAIERLVDRADARLQVGVIGRGNVEELDAAVA